MKSLRSLLLVFMLLAGCANQGSNTDQEKTQTGSAQIDKVVVNVTMQDGKLTSVKMDELDAKSADGTKSGSKKELGDAYGMKAASGIQKEWHEQIKALEDYIVKNGVDAVKTEEGKVINDDLKTSVTINVDKFLEATKQAIQDAK